jgi:hypothetical protein
MFVSRCNLGASTVRLTPVDSVASLSAAAMFVVLWSAYISSIID